MANYFAYGLVPGDTFYLSVDEDVLVDISKKYFEQANPSDAINSFTLAIRDECVYGRRVILPATDPRKPYDAPACLAFLGAMVLAANRMAPEDDIAEINYFTRLREILGITGERGRPPGLTPGAPEEEQWISLNDWILRNGWNPSAIRGPDGPIKFTNYPLSQSLLRKGDKGKLANDFRNAERELGRNADRERISAWFFNRATDFSTHHIRSLAQDVTADRYEALVDAVYTVYASIDWESEHTSSMGRSPHRLSAGLYRDFNPLSGKISYYLFPRRRYKDSRMNLSVKRNSGELVPLYQEQDGQFRPLWPIDPKGGETYQVTGDPQIMELHVPSRSFWILTRDQYDDSVGTLASRGAPRVGQTFLLLCREECKEQLYVLRDEGLMEWDGDPVTVPEYDGWVEYRECMVLSASWSGVTPQLPELFDELRPSSRASISLLGGLKAAGRDIWLEGYGPKLFITSFDPTCRVSVTNASRRDLEPVLDEAIGNETSVELPHLAAGDYLVQTVSATGRPTDRRYIRMVSWDALQPKDSTLPLGTTVGDHMLRGGLLTQHHTELADGL